MTMAKGGIKFCIVGELAKNYINDRITIAIFS